jgi:hypothetical protein
MRNVARWQWALLALILAVAFLLRAYDLPRIFMWLDETDFFNEHVYRNPPAALIDFAVSTKNATTNTWGWPAIIWIACRMFGSTIGVARAPSVLVGTAAVLLLFTLVYRMLPPELEGKRFFPAAIAAAIAAVAMPQVEFSQRTYPYGATPFLAAAFLLAHLGLLSALRRKPDGRDLLPAAILYTLAGTAAVCIHVSVALLIGASLAFLTLPAARNFAGRSPSERGSLAGLAGGMGVAFLIAGLLNAKNPRYGFRPYLERYYHQPSLHSLIKLLLHVYDFATYHLNLFYNPALYWPESVNWAILPLVLLCALGWGLAVAGRFGWRARHLALLGMFAVALPAGLSLVRVFPFGGVRQTLFLSPFVLAFTALGFWALASRPALRILGAAAAVAYLGLWAINLPRFYRERVTPYSAQDLVTAWRQNGEIQVYMRGGNEREIEYTLRQHPEIPLRSLPLLSKAPYLLITTHYQIDDPIWFAGYRDYLAKSHYQVALLAERPPAHPESEQYSTCLYFPPNGLWIYKVTAQ